MELTQPPAVRRLNGEDRQADGRPALVAPKRDDDLSERGEAEGSSILVEWDYLAPFPAERLWLCRNGSEVMEQRIAVATVAGRSDQYGRIVEEGNKGVRLSAIDRRLKRAENGVCLGQRVGGHNRILPGQASLPRLMYPERRQGHPNTYI